eukprot:4031598-Karenia_brevis.AAC.1
MSELTVFGIDTPPLNVTGDNDIIPDDGTEPNRRRKIRRILEQPEPPIRMIGENLVYQLGRGSSPVGQQEAEIEKWIAAHQQTAIKYHDPENMEPLRPPIRAPGQAITYRAWDNNYKLDNLVPTDFVSAGQVMNKAPMTNTQSPLFKKAVGKLFPGDNKPRSFIVPYDTQKALNYGDMRLVEINERGTEIMPTMLMDINAMAFGISPGAPPEVANVQHDSSESDDDTTAGQAAFPVRTPTSAVIRHREPSRTPERSARARDRDAVKADLLFQIYVRESTPFHEEMANINRDPESWLIFTRAQLKRALSIWRTVIGSAQA